MIVPLPRLARSSFMSIVVLVLFLLSPLPALAASDWFTRFGASVVTTTGSAWESQKMGHYAGGGVSIRYPVDTTPFVHISTPRIQAGCGGIDVFWGGLSFLNPEFLIQKLKNIMMAAPAYAFDYALKHLCPSCSQLLKDLEALANQLNQLAMDDCAATAFLVEKGGDLLASVTGYTANKEDKNTGANWLDTAAKVASNEVQDWSKSLADFLENLWGCDDKTGTDKDKCKKEYTIKGSLWHLVAERVNERAGNYKIDSSFVRLAQSIYGDIVFRMPDETDDASGSAKKPLIDYVQACDGSMDSFVNAMLDVAGTEKIKIRLSVVDSINIPICIEQDANEVLSGLGTDYFYFGKRATVAIQDLKTKMVGGSPLNADTLVMINQSAIPVYQAINILNLRGLGVSNLSGEEDVLQGVLAAGNALYVTFEFHRAALEILNEGIVYVRSRNLSGLYSEEAISTAVTGMRDNFAYVERKIYGKLKEKTDEFQKRIKEIVDIYAMRTVFQTALSTRTTQ